MFVKLEGEKLSYLRQNQPKLRASEFTVLAEKLGDGQNDFDEVEAVRHGRLVVLPSTHVGSDRYLRQKRQDIIALAVEHGHPDIFLTFTCNPQWVEIQQECERTNSKPADRPDLCNRVFAMKLKEALRYIKDEKIFGNVIGYVQVIEFQKRGLVHAHVVLFLDGESKKRLADPAEVDKIIKAEIPGNDDEELRKRVIHHMIHGPCNTGTDERCLSNGTCKRHFPKEFSNETPARENEFYVTYRRRSPAEGGETFKTTVKNQEIEVENQLVVPYNPKLLCMFDAHINVEMVLSMRGSIKYLFKNICKGPDRCVVTVRKDTSTGEEVSSINEIQQYIDARFVSATFAVWNFLGYPLFENTPSVERLSIHLEGKDVVYFRQGNEQDALSKHKASKLTAFFNT